MPRGSNRVVFASVVAGFLAAAIALALSVVAFGGPADAQTTGCGTIQSRVNNAPSGATIDLPDGCVYRETVSVNKPLTLRGGPGVEIRGSDVWTNWTKSGVYWVKGTLPSFIVKGECKTGTARCRWPEQVFFDGRPLLQVASNPKSGQFAVNRSSKQVVLADDPAGHRVEVSTRRQWVVGQSGGVTIENFSMTHAANEAQTGAIKNAVPGIAQGYDNWTVRNNRLSYAHGPLVTLGDATGLRLTGNDIHHSGQLGVNGSYASLEVRNNKIHHNNTEGFRTDWAAGGMKNTHMSRLVADGNEVYENDWTGLWCDEGCRNVTYSNNRVHHNEKRGIHFEISDGATITGNVLWENGWGVETSGDPGIAVAARDVDVGYNTLAWNNDGIVVVNADRPHGDGTQYDLVKNVRVHHNDILSKDYPGGSHLALNWIKACAGGNIYDPIANNRGHDNRYWYPSAEGSPMRYGWSSKYPRLSQFNATLGEERGRYLTATEKNILVASKGIPASPER